MFMRPEAIQFFFLTLSALSQVLDLLPLPTFVWKHVIFPLSNQSPNTLPYAY